MNTFQYLTTLGLLFLVGCSVIENPICTSDEIILLDDFEGEWIVSLDDTKGRVQITSIPGSKKYRIRPLDAGAVSNEVMEASVTKIGAISFLDVFVPTNVSLGHTIFRIDSTDKRSFTITLFDPDQARGHDLLSHEVEQLRLDTGSCGIIIPVPRTISDAGIRITASTGQLREFFEQHPDLYWGNEFELTRID